MENVKVAIYALIDPITCKVRYIGRTSRKLNDRLSSHLNDAKYHKRNTHKEHWINSLLEKGHRPIIKKLTTVIGFKESYSFEIKLIEKYKNRLTNHFDKGPGHMRNLSEDSKKQIAETLKFKFRNGIIPLPKGKKIYVYLRNGEFYKEFDSLSQCVKELNTFKSTITKHINKSKWTKPDPRIPTKDGRKRILRTPYQYSDVKVEKMFDYDNQ